MEENQNCLICYKTFPGRRRSTDMGPQDYNRSEEKLFNVFCKYMQVDEDTCDEPFCLHCKEIMWSLHQLNCEVQVLNRLTSRLTAKCIAKIIESWNEETHQGEDSSSGDDRPVNAIRRIIYDRFNARVVLTHNAPFSFGVGDVTNDNFDQSEVQIEGDSDHDDPEFLMNGDDNNESDDEEWSKGRLTRQMRNIATKTVRKVAHAGENPEEIHYNEPKYSEISPGKYMFRGQYPFRTVGDIFQCESCGKTFEELDAILSHLRNHFRKRKRRQNVKVAYNRLIEIAPNKLLYANKYPICFVAGKYRCSLCLKARASKYKLVDHIKEVHMKRGQKIHGTTGPNDKVTMETGDVQQNPEEASTCSIREGGVKMEASLVAGCNTLEDAEYDQTGDGNIVPLVRKKFEPTEEMLDPYASGFADPTRSVEESLPVDIKEIETTERASSKAFQEISPGRFRLGEFEFEKVGDVFRCSTCHRTFKMKVEVTTHVRKRHYNKSFLTGRTNYAWRELEPSRYLYGNYVVQLTGGRYQCPECPKSTTLRLKIMEHIRTVHIVQTAPLICEECGKSFPTTNSFRNHQRTHGTQSFACSLCSKTFARPEYLERHARIHRGDEAKNKICEYCGKKFFNNPKLLSHLSRHDGVKRFACNYCDQRFRTYDTMRLHRNVCATRKIQERREDKSADENVPANSLDEHSDNVNDVLVVTPLQAPPPVEFEFSVDSLFYNQDLT